MEEDYSTLGYLRINLWHRLMEAIHTAISPINCISGPRDYRRQMVDRLHLNEGFSVIRGDFLCTYLFPRLWRGPGQCGLSSLQKMELGTGQADAHTPRPTAQFSKCQPKSAPPAVFTILAVGTDFLCFTALQPSCSLIVLWPLLRPKRKGCDSLVYGV